MFCIEAIELIHLMYYYTGILFIVLREGWVSPVVHKFICRKPAVTRTNDQRLTNLYGSVLFHIQHRLVLFSGPLKLQAGSFNR